MWLLPLHSLGGFYLTRTGIAAELTAASEQRLPPVVGEDVA